MSSSHMGVSFQGTLTEAGPGCTPTGAVPREAVLYIERQGIRLVTKGGRSETILHERILASWTEKKEQTYLCCFERESFNGASSTQRFELASEIDAIAMREALRGAASAKAAHIEAALVEVERKTKRPVLYVDYRAQQRRRVVNRIKAAGFAVEVASTSLEALKMWTESPNKFCIIMTEVLMPTVTGWDIARQIRAVEALRDKEAGFRGKAMPILAVSAGRTGDEDAIDDGSPEDQRYSSLVSHCEAAGMNAYCDLNCSVKRLQWELCQLARKECAAADAPAPGTPAPVAVSHQLTLEDENDEEIDEALAEWKRRYVNEWKFRALFVPFIFARKSRRMFRQTAPSWMNTLVMLLMGEGAKG